MSESAVWPGEHGETIRALVTTGFLISACTLSAFLSNRFTGVQSFRELSLARILVLALLFDSFLFVLTSAILVLGIGTSLNDVACQVGIWWCILLYATTKVFIYLFLMERVYLVYCHTAGGRVPRFESRWYQASAVLLALWIVVAVLMIVGRIAYLREDGACVIGVKLFATGPMLAVDAVTNLFLTSAFVIPIARSKFRKAQKLARKSVLAAMMALITSFANIMILAIQHGKQLSWVCLGSCGIDVSLNAAIIFFVTSSDTRTERPSLSGLAESGLDETGDVNDGDDMVEASRPRRQDGTAVYLPEGIEGPRSNPFPTFKQHRPAPGAGASTTPGPEYPDDLPTLHRTVSTPLSDVSEDEGCEKSRE